MLQEIMEAQESHPNKSRHLYVLSVSSSEDEYIFQVYQSHELTQPASLLQSTLQPSHKYHAEVIPSYGLPAELVHRCAATSILFTINRNVFSDYIWRTASK
ncbi:hypothetical protein PMIT1320_00755 [Prochlorococcus marinus str. MIT 1320]|nr:hypothetical protein PMIT1320_00755 [Prochlorococcus marinus str. MIT 1320]